MIKILLVIFTLALLTSCSGGDSGRVKELEQDLRVSQEVAQSCQQQLEVARSFSAPGVDTSYQAPEPEQPSCETVELSKVFVDGKELATCRESTETACGISLNGCEDGFAYSCLKNVKYKTIEKEICE